MTPTEASFLTGLKRVINSAKVQVTTASLAAKWTAIHFAVAGMDQNQRAALWIAFLAAATVEVREVVNAWSAEDVARLQNQSPAPTPLPTDPPAPPDAPPAPVASPKPSPKPAPVTASATTWTVTTPRPTPRTKLP